MSLTDFWFYGLIGVIVAILILWKVTKDKRNFYKAVITSFVWCWPAFIIEWYGICVIGIWYNPNITGTPPVPWSYLFLAFIGGIGLLNIFRRIYHDKTLLIFFIITAGGTGAFTIAMSILSGKWAHRFGWNPYYGFLHVVFLMTLLVVIDMLFEKYKVFDLILRGKSGE